jgi:hypothetical protein
MLSAVRGMAAPSKVMGSKTEKLVKRGTRKRRRSHVAAILHVAHVGVKKVYRQTSCGVIEVSFFRTARIAARHSLDYEGQEEFARPRQIFRLLVA